MKRFLIMAAMLTAGPALAQEAPLGLHEARAILATPVAQAGTIIVDGRTWRCDGAVCTGRSSSAPLSQPVTHECQRVAKALGPVLGYRSREDRDERVLAAGCRRPA
jgi:hypothetical protein